MACQRSASFACLLMAAVTTLAAAPTRADAQGDRAGAQVLLSQALRETSPAAREALLRQSVSAAKMFDNCLALGDLLAGARRLEEARVQYASAYERATSLREPVKRPPADAALAAARVARTLEGDPACIGDRIGWLKRALALHRTPEVEAALRSAMAPPPGSPAMTAAEIQSRLTWCQPPPRGSAVVESIDMRIEFDFGRDELTSQGQRQLVELARALSSGEVAQRPFVLTGHTDAVGTADYNEGLSWRRAESVKRFLVAQGVSAARITTAGKGLREPLFEGDAEDVRALNRRVEVRLQ